MADNTCTQQIEDEPLAPAGSLLGQIQRGRGAGFLWALRENPATVRPLVAHCITRDPRWDSQVEDRADYYARLGMQVQMDLAPLEGYLRATAGGDDDSPTSLTLGTLGKMALMGSGRAVRILREYVAYGPNWDYVLDELAELPGTDATEGLAEVICARFETGAQMQESATYMSFRGAAGNPLWETWAQAHPCIQRLLREAREALPPRQWHAKVDYKALPVEELLAVADARNRREIEKILLGRLRRADTNIYAAAFSGDNPFAWQIAFQCLAAMKQVAPFYDLVRERLTAYIESADSADMRGGKVRAIEWVLQQLPPEMTLPLARRWFDTEEWPLYSVGEGILEDHATIEDLPRARAALAATLEKATPHNTEVFRVCAALEILARFKGAGPLPEVEEAFVELGYAYGRARAAKAMWANAPMWFSERYAYECLWDCEEMTRELGCEGVAAANPKVRERLQYMANDPFEADAVRQAAAMRLAGT